MTDAGERPILDTVHNASISNHSTAIFYYTFLLFGPGSWWAKCYARARTIYVVTRCYKNPIKACFLGRAAIPSSTTAPRLNHPQILCIFIIFYIGVLSLCTSRYPVREMLMQLKSQYGNRIIYYRKRYYFIIYKYLYINFNFI